MKKVLLNYLLFFYASVYAQNQISFTDVPNAKIDLSAILKNYEILKITENIDSFSDGEKLTLSYRKDYVFILDESKLFSNDYKVIIKNDHGIEYKKLDELNFDGTYFLNADRSRNHQLALSSFEGQYSFYVKSSGKEFYIEPLIRFNNEASLDEYVYYEVKDIVETVAECGEEDKNFSSLDQTRNQMIQPNLDCKVVELNFCVDYSLYSAYNSINVTVNRNMEVLNLTQLDYSIANGLSFDVNFKLNRHYIITCNNCNYWPTTNNLLTNNSAFLQFENYSQIFDVKSDIKVFWQNSIDIPGGAAALGYGTLGGLENCNTQDSLVIRGNASLLVFPNIINSGRGTLTHEFGHNFGCPHINTSNNIMYFGGSSGSYWEPASVAIINNRLNISPCFTECQTELCFNKKIENLSVTLNSNSSQLNINWLSEPGMEYKLRLYTYNTNTWSTYTTVSYPQNSLVLPYVNTTTCNNKFKIEIVPVCSSINGFSQTMVLRSTSDAPNPYLFFQSTAQYETLCSGTSYTFSVGARYPGNNPIYQWKINGIPVGTNAPDFTTNTLQNNDILSCQITSNDPCLTTPTTAISRTVIVAPQPCDLSNTDFDLNTVSYFPNPVKDLFTIKSLREIKNISIFNIIGQKLSQNSVYNTETTLDLSIFPNATYFIKIEVDGLVKTIKIVKE